MKRTRVPCMRVPYHHSERHRPAECRWPSQDLKNLQISPKRRIHLQTMAIPPKAAQEVRKSKDPRTYDFKVRRASSPVVQSKRARHLLRPLSSAPLRASQRLPRYQALTDHLGSVSNLYSKYHHFQPSHHALTRRTSLHQLSNVTNQMALGFRRSMTN